MYEEVAAGDVGKYHVRLTKNNEGKLVVEVWEPGEHPEDPETWAYYLFDCWPEDDWGGVQP